LFLLLRRLRTLASLPWPAGLCRRVRRRGSYGQPAEDLASRRAWQTARRAPAKRLQTSPAKVPETLPSVPGRCGNPESLRGGLPARQREGTAVRTGRGSSHRGDSSVVGAILCPQLGRGRL